MGDSNAVLAGSLRLRQAVRGLALFAVLLVLSSGMLRTTEARATSDPVTIERVFRPTGPPGYPANLYPTQADLYASWAARRLYAFSNGVSWVSAYDLDSLQEIGAGMDPGGTTTGVFPDPAEPVVFSGIVTNAEKVLLREYASRPSGVTVVGVLDLTPQLAGRSIIGMYRLPRSDVAWLVSAGGDGHVAITEVLLTGIESNTAQHHWTMDLPQCLVAMHGNSGVPAAIGYVQDGRSGGSLYFGCGNPPLAAISPPVPRGAARLRLGGDPGVAATTPGEFSIFTRAGDFSKATSAFDPGSGRLVMSAYSSVTGGASVYVFDATTDGYVGGIAAGPVNLNEAGLDPLAGRFYGLGGDAGTGLLIADVRPTPPSQGVNVGALHEYNGAHPFIGANMAVDPVTRRAWVKYTSGDFLVVRDNVAPYVARPVDDPDRQTTNVPEVAGKTAATYAASVQGYGQRIRQVGGTQALVANFAGVDPRTVPVGQGTREFRGAYLNQLIVGNDEASASAISADVDPDNTKVDLGKTDPTALLPEPPPSGTPSGQAVTWPYNAALCADFGNGAPAVTENGASVTCNASGHVATAQAAQQATMAGPISVGDSTLRADTRLDPARGAMAHVEVSTRNISLLGGQLRIGEVAVTSTAWARGRPQTADTSFVRVVRNVTLNGTEVCTGQCNPDALAALVNSRLNPYVKVTFPMPDPAFVHGSKGGYQALVRRAPLELLDEILSNEQPADRQEVPGMVITVSQDGFKPARTVIELAGAETEAHYGIQVLDEFGPDANDTQAVAALVDAGTPGAGQGPLFGLTAGPIEGFMPPLAAGGTAGSRSLPPIAVPGSAGRYLLNSLGRAGALLPIWAMLLVPVYLSARRLLLLQRQNLATPRH